MLKHTSKSDMPMSEGVVEIKILTRWYFESCPNIVTSKIT